MWSSSYYRHVENRELIHAIMSIKHGVYSKLSKHATLGLGLILLNASTILMTLAKFFCLLPLVSTRQYFCMEKSSASLPKIVGVR